MQSRQRLTVQMNGPEVALAAMLSLMCGCAPSLATHALPNAATTEQRRTIAIPRSNETVLYSFDGYTDGGDPAADLVADSSGDIFGTTVVGGQYACGTVFKLAPAKKQPWNESVLYSFDCYGHGKNPYGGVAFDARGNLDGTTVSGGAGSCGSSGCGIVFQLAASGETVLHDFTAGADGFGPGGGVAIDKDGNLYGTTPDGGLYSAGVVYSVSHGRKGSRETVIHSFTGGTDGSVGSLGRLLVDASGNLYGVAEEGGAGYGTVFKLSHHKRHWQLTTLYAFEGTPDAASPYGGLIADSSGDLFGTTYYGGNANAGTVFELARNGSNYRERVLYGFKGGVDGSNPTGTLVFGASGDLYGTTSNGGGSCGSYGCGVVFALDPRSKKERLLHSFSGGNDGQHPYYGLLLGKKGVLYGTTAAGGRSGQGVVFEVKP